MENIRRQRGLRWEVPVVDIPLMADRFGDENILLAIPGNDRPIVAGTKFVVRIAAELFEPVRSPVFRLVKFLDRSLLSFCVEPLQ